MLAQTLHKNALNGSAVDMVTYWRILLLDYWCITSSNNNSDVTKARGGGGGGFPYISYTGTCHWKEYGFQAI